MYAMLRGCSSFIFHLCDFGPFNSSPAFSVAPIRDRCPWLPHPPAVTASSSLTVWFQSWRAVICDRVCVVHALGSSDTLHSSTYMYSACVYYLLSSCAYHNLISRRLSQCFLLCKSVLAVHSELRYAPIKKQLFTQTLSFQFTDDSRLFSPN